MLLLRVQCKASDDGQRKCPKHVDFYSKNKFEKLVHLVGCKNCPRYLMIGVEMCLLLTRIKTQ